MPFYPKLKALSVLTAALIAPVFPCLGADLDLSQEFATYQENSFFSIPGINKLLDDNYALVQKNGYAELRIPKKYHTMSIDMLPPGNRIAVDNILKSGYNVYLVGGQVRDYLMGSSPNDFDLVTTAPIRDLDKILGDDAYLEIFEFHNHLYAHADILGEEISLANLHNIPAQLHGIKGIPEFNPAENFTTSLLNNTYVRDFTYNSLFMDLRTMDIIDYHGGIRDIRDGILRPIGPAELVMTPSKIIRAFRFKARFKHKFSPDLEAYMRNLDKNSTIKSSDVADQLPRIFIDGFASEGLKVLLDYEMLDNFIRPLRPYIKDSDVLSYLENVTNCLDHNYIAGRKASDELLLGSLLSPALEAQAEKLGVDKAISKVLDDEADYYDYEVYKYRDGKFRPNVESLLRLSHKLILGTFTDEDLKSEFINEAMVILQGWAKSSTDAGQSLEKVQKALKNK